MEDYDFETEVWGNPLSLCMNYYVRHRTRRQEENLSYVSGLPESELPRHWTTILDVLSPELLKIAFDNGLSNSVTTDRGLTLLHVLVKNCFRNYDVRSFSYMLYIMKDNGVDVNIQDDDGNTPLHLCYKCLDSKANDDVFAQILYQLEADYSIKNNEGKTPDDIFDNLPANNSDDNQQEYFSDEE